MSDTIRVLIADDSAAVRGLLRTHLSTQPHIEVVGAVDDGDVAVKEAKRLKPDLVLMDISMPRMSGLEATKQIKARRRAPRLIIVSLNDDEQHRKAAANAGADGFCSKTDAVSKLIPMIRAFYPELAAESN